ncbi:MAG: dTDP-4-dehydrorhamnose reductase [Prevotellaceae bacterium]|jgi:dTDP-4-dehydrorhamnose reductase|nr:dTDP-4-dehydrorhamnose reductase [Prevotellaceae bacterium]
MKILVTGSNGQLGSELQKLSVKNHYNQYVFTDFDELDITDINAVKAFFTEYKPDFLINCAAYTAVDKAESDYAKAMLINADAVANLADSCKICNTAFFHISTDYVFDGEKASPYTESDSPNPVSAYGKTKLLGEQNALAYRKTIVIRTSWLYSTFGNNFVKTMLRLGSEHKKVRVVADQTGSPTYAEDLAAALLKIIEKIIENPENMKPGIYNFANEGQCSWYDFAKEIMKLGNKNCTVEAISTAEYPTAAQRPHYSLLSTEKIKNTYYVDVPHWQTSLQRCINQLTADNRKI